MTFLFVLAILVSGFGFIHIHPRYFYKLHRYENQYLYLKSAWFGLSFFSASAIVVSLIFYFWGNPVKNNTIFSKEYNDFYIFAIFSMALSLLFMPFGIGFDYLRLWIINRNIKNFKKYFLLKTFENSPMDSLLAWSSQSNDINSGLIRIDLSDRRVYVGKVLSMGEPTETLGADQEISIVPIMSGYREKDTNQVVYVNHYLKNTSELVELVIKRELIQTATKYSLKVYDDFKVKRTRPQKKIP